jgi:Restriction endonuclease S subunits
MVRLVDVCEKKIQFLPANSDFEIEYIDISSIDNESKQIVSSKVIEAKDAPSRAKQLLKQNDILVSTVRPNLNAVAILKQTSDRVLVGSTGYCILRCKNEALQEYVFYFCRSRRFVRSLVKVSKGASYPAVSDNDVKNLQIPLPPLEVQKKIAQTLDAAAKLIALRKKQLAELDNLVKSVFYDMFGDPVVNEKGWKTKVIKDVCSDIVDCPHSTPIHSETPTKYPSIRTSELQNGNINWKSMKYVNEVEYLKRISRTAPQADDIIYGREGSYGEAAILPSGYSFCLGQRVMLLRANKAICNHIFLWYVVRSDYVYNQARQKNVGATVGHVNVADIKNFIIPLPPLPLQNQFAEIVAKIEEQKALVQKAIDESQYLFDSLVSEYFD